MNQVLVEEWKPIPDFPNYQISNLGNIYNNRRSTIMRTSVNNFGHLKITLLSDWNGERYTRSVAQMVAEAFVSPPGPLSDCIVVLDGNFLNVASNNLVWRTPRFAWKYTRQLKVPQPIYYRNLNVVDVVTGNVYNSIVEAGMKEGLLFEDIWRSTYMGSKVYPNDSIFEILE